jgi:hypothetical protein
VQLAGAAPPNSDPAQPAAPESGKAGEKKSKLLPETQEALPWVSNHEIKKETNPFTERDWRMVTYAWTGFILRLLLIFGAIFSVYQFLLAREEKRVERTLQLVELWEQDSYQEAQTAIRARIAGLNEKYAGLLGSKPGQAEMEVYFQRVGIEAMTADGGTMPLPEFQQHFDRVVYFLNRMSFCVEGNLCSREIVDAYFRDYAVSFWNYFSGYVEQQRKAGLTSYAMPVERYVRSDDLRPGATE